MVSTFWDIPGILSGKTLELLEGSLGPICIYDDRGQFIYSSSSFIHLFPGDLGKTSFFDYFATLLPSAAPQELWNQAFRGETVAFLIPVREGRREIKCTLQFNPETGVMLLVAQINQSQDFDSQLIAEYEQRVSWFKHPNLATALINLDGTVVKCDRKLYQLLGVEYHEIFSIEDFVHPDDRAIDANLKQRLIVDDAGSYSVEKRFIARNGDIVWIYASVFLLKVTARSGECKRYFLALYEDVTENRKVYSALVRTEEKWKAFILNSSYLFIQTNNTGQIIYTSPAFEKLLGYQEAELIGRNVSELIHPRDLRNFQRVYSLWLNESTADRSPIEFWWKAKTERWFCLAVQGRGLPSTLEMEGIVISGYDITRQKQLEMKLKASKEKFKSLLLNSPGAVFRCDTSYTMKFISNSIESITGYPASTFINNQTRAFISIVHPEDIALIRDSLVQSTLDYYRSSIEYRIIHVSGQIRWVFEHKQGILDQSGNLRWLDGILVDISDRKGDKTLSVEPIDLGD
jgi:PAS domain S-box-containing protein